MSSPAGRARKKSAVRHTRAIARNRQHHPASPPPAPAVAARLSELIQPATWAQVATFRTLGLRERVLTLPIMVAFVLSLIWRQLGSVTEAVRTLNLHGVLWAPPTSVSQQAAEQRLRNLPPRLFAAVWADVLPQLHARWQARTRPLPPVLAWTEQEFTAVLAFDGSTLDALLRKVGLLRQQVGSALGGRMAAIVHVASGLPQTLLYQADSTAHDQTFWEHLAAHLAPGCLVLFDLGFVNYTYFAYLTDHEVWFLTPAKSNAVYTIVQVLAATATLHDSVIQLGTGATRCAVALRRIAVWHEGGWRVYLTNVLDPARLPGPYAPRLYAERWRIEDAFGVVKRLLGLAYLWSGAGNAIQTQVWATWLLYGVVLDLVDEVAERLHVATARVSVELVFRGLSHYAQAVLDGEEGEAVEYLVAHAPILGLVKRHKRANLAPLPADPRHDYQTQLPPPDS
jgi:hypothetical protein